MIMVRRFALALFVWGLSTTSWANTDSAQRLENVQAEIQSLSKSLDESKKNRAELQQQLEKQSKAVSDLSRSLHDLAQQLKQKDQELKRLEQEQQQYRQSHAKQLTALGSQLRAAYLNAGPNYLKVLLSQHEPAKLSRSSTYFHYFHQARQQQLDGITASLKTLTHNRQTLLTAQQQQQKLYQQQQIQQQQLQQKNQQRLATAKQLDLKMNQQGARVASLREQEQSLQALLQSIAKQAKPVVDSNQAFAKRKGSLPWPVNGKVITHYGSSRNLGKLTWQGIMINAPSGREIISTAPGRVVFSDWLRGFGLLLIIDHGDKYMTLYGNNQSLLKAVGDTVNTGDLIALSGDQGIRQYTGLYFELRHQGNPTDPTKWLAKQS